LKTRRSKSSIPFSKEGLVFSLLLSSTISFFTYSGLQPAPFRISKENFENKILKNISHAGEKKIMVDSYAYQPDEKNYYLKNEVLEMNREGMKKWIKVTEIIKNTGFKYSWGIISDKYWHISIFPSQFMRLQLPSSMVIEKKVTHRGVQIFLITITSFLKQFRNDNHFLDRLVDVYKMSALAFWFSLLYLVFIFSRIFLKLSIKISVLVLLSLLFYAPILFPFFQTLGKQSFQGFLTPTGSVYKNAPQLFSTAVCLGGMLLLFLSHKKKVPSFFWGCFLISASFFFKPALFTIIAPVIFFMSIFDGDRFLPDKISGYLILIMVPLYYKLYPIIFNFPSLEKFTFSLAPFELIFDKTKNLFPGIITQHKVWHVLSVFLMSFGALISAVIYSAPVQFKKIKEFGIVKYVCSKKVYFYTSLPFVLGVLSYCLLIQVEMRMAGNFGWLSGAGILIFVPVYIKLISKIDRKSIKYFTWLLFGLHLLNGIIYLFKIFL
jgi:hypothetical protein